MYDKGVLVITIKLDYSKIPSIEYRYRGTFKKYRGTFKKYRAHQWLQITLPQNVN